MRGGVYTIYPCSRALPYFLNDLLLGDGTGSYGIYANYDEHRLYSYFFQFLPKSITFNLFFFNNKKSAIIILSFSKVKPGLFEIYIHREKKKRYCVIKCFDTLVRCTKDCLNFTFSQIKIYVSFSQHL